MTGLAFAAFPGDGAAVGIASRAQGKDHHLAQKANGDNGDGQFVKSDARKKMRHVPNLVVSCSIAMTTTYWRKGAEK